MTFSVIQIAQKLRVVTVCSHPFYFELWKLLRVIYSQTIKGRISTLGLLLGPIARLMVGANLYPANLVPSSRR